MVPDTMEITATISVVLMEIKSGFQQMVEWLHSNSAKCDGGFVMLELLANAVFIAGIIALSAVPLGALITLCKGEWE
jgi:hypothetical protein